MKTLKAIGITILVLAIFMAVAIVISLLPSYVKITVGVIVSIIFVAMVYFTAREIL